MTGHKSTKRYVNALFDLAVENKKVDKVYKDLQSLRELLNESDDLSRFIQSPLVPVAQRNKSLNALFEKKASPLVLTFLLFLSEQERLFLLQEICEEFEKVYLDSEGILKVKIISAHKMQKDQIDAVSAKLQKYYQKKIETEAVVDETMIGGFKILAKDRIYDLTVRTQLEKYRTAVMTT